MSLIHVGLLRGGPSNEFDISLQTGNTVIKNLDPQKYKISDIFIDKKGVWHFGGSPIEPHEAIHRVDVIFNALHGAYGEDGKVQHLLDYHHVPYTGSDAVSSAVGMNKLLAKQVFAAHGMKTPVHRVLARDTDARELFRSFPMPAVIKPVSGGSSIGVSIIKTFADLEKALEYDGDLVIEEYIPGVEASCGVIAHYRDVPLYVLPVAEIHLPANSFFDYDAKYKGTSEEIIPGRFSQKIKDELSLLAQKAHEALSLRHYSRSDFIIHPKRGIYILEINTLPGLTAESLFPKSLAAVGGTLPHFFDHLLELALSRK